LFAFKKANTALWNGKWGATMVNALNSAPTQVFSFVRQNEHDKVFAVFNFSDQAQTMTFTESLGHGTYTDYFSDETVEFLDSTQLTLAPWALLECPLDTYFPEIA
jgi:Maltogenic Amylase, C-terminal domain